MKIGIQKVFKNVYQKQSEMRQKIINVKIFLKGWHLFCSSGSCLYICGHRILTQQKCHILLKSARTFTLSFSGLFSKKFSFHLAQFQVLHEKFPLRVFSLKLIRIITTFFIHFTPVASTLKKKKLKHYCISPLKDNVNLNCI